MKISILLTILILLTSCISSNRITKIVDNELRPTLINTEYQYFQRVDLLNESENLVSVTKTKGKFLPLIFYFGCESSFNCLFDENVPNALLEKSVQDHFSGKNSSDIDFSKLKLKLITAPNSFSQTQINNTTFLLFSFIDYYHNIIVSDSSDLTVEYSYILDGRSLIDTVSVKYPLTKKFDQDTKSTMTGDFNYNMYSTQNGPDPDPRKFLKSYLEYYKKTYSSLGVQIGSRIVKDIKSKEKGE